MTTVPSFYSLEISSELQVVLDNQLTFIYANELFKSAMKYADDSLLQTSFADWLHPESKQDFIQLVDALQPLEIRHFECHLINPQSQELVHIQGKIGKTDDGLLQWAGSLVINQTSPLARFKRFFDLELLDLMIITDHQGNMVHSNQGLVRKLGYTLDYLQNNSLLDIIHPDDREITAQYVRDMRKSENVVLLHLNRCIDIEGKVIWLAWKGVYHKSYIYALANDVTEANDQKIQIQKLLDRTIKQNRQMVASRKKLKAALDILAERNYELDQFVYHASHDLRSPLTSILGLVHLSKLDSQNYPMIAEYLERIEKSTRRLDNFIQSLLDFSRVNRTENQLQNIDLSQIIQECLEDLAYSEQFGNLDIRVSIKGSNPFRSDISKIRVIFSNLISNAIKYQKPDQTGNYLQINIDQTTPANTIIFLEDNGIGIANNYLPRLFEMFFRATETVSGSGLGLYIVDKTVKKLNGQIYLCSEVNQGTLIKLTLPSNPLTSS